MHTSDMIGMNVTDDAPLKMSWVCRRPKKQTRKRGDRGRLRQRNWIKRLKRLKKECPLKWAILCGKPVFVSEDYTIRMSPPESGYLFTNVME